MMSSFKRGRAGLQPYALMFYLSLCLSFCLSSSLYAQTNPQESSEKEGSEGEGWVMWGEEAPEPSSPLPTEGTSSTEVIEVTVEGEREARAQARGASDVVVSREVLQAAPKSEGAEALRAAPGLYIGRNMGPAVAHSYTLRGFNAEHGQDIAFSVAGLPINLPSHIHGQGYADLGLLIGEVVGELDVSEGVYDPRQGDFAVAGSIDVSLSVPESERGQRLALKLGAFGERVVTATWAPHTLPEESLVAVQLEEREGFGAQRSGGAATLLAQHLIKSGRWSTRLFVGARSARSALPGVLRRDDINAGRVCFECTYNLPTARAQGAFTQRLMASALMDHKEPDGGRLELKAWASVDRFRAQHNFTGFIERSHTLLNVSGRGDLIEQQNATSSFGAMAAHQSAPWSLWGVRATLELGSSARLDLINQSQRLLDASSRLQAWDERVDAELSGLDLAAWLDLELKTSLAARPLTLHLGARADSLAYQVNDALGNFTPASRPSDSYLMGYARSAQGVAYGPRLSARWALSEPLSLTAAYGEGYRSPQARTLEDGERAPFTSVRSGDLGLKLTLGEALELSVGGYLTTLSDDVSFDPGEGRLERVGATERLGGTLHIVWRPLSWALVAGSVTAVRATLLEPPPPTAEEPQPPFVKGQPLPFVAPWVSRLDLSAKRAFTHLLGRPLEGKLGAGLSHLSPRPLPYNESSPQLLLLDLSAGLTLKSIKPTQGEWALNLELFNALNTRYVTNELVFASDWSPQDGVRGRTPARHVVAGPPRAWGVSLSWRR